MAKEIKQKIVLEGEKQYNQAIRDAQRNLRTLKSELKAETAELGANATAQQKNEAKTKSLRQQIREQEKIVQTLREALKEVKAQYGDNADEVARWEQRLNGARTTLAGMKNDLENAGSGFQAIRNGSAQAITATNSAAEAMERIGSAAESAAGVIESVFSGIISTIKSAVTEVWGLITETAAKANRWTDLAGYYGSSAQEIQMWDNSITAAGGDFQKFLNIVNQLAFGGKEQKITELLGISHEGYEDDIQYTLAVLDELERRREELGQGWYDDTMSELFGARRSADVSWFLANAQGHEASNGEWIEGWRSNPQRFNGNEGPYGLEDQELKDLNDVYVLLNNIQTKWADIKRQIAGGLGTAALEITTSVNGFLDGLAEYMNAENDEDREAALTKMRENMEKFFRAVAQIIRDCVKILTDLGEELKESEDPATRMIGEIMTGLADALNWMIEHQDEVKTALEVIFGAWLVLKLASIAGKLTSIVASIKTIQLFNGWNPGTTPTTTPTTPPTTTPTTTPTTAPTTAPTTVPVVTGGGGAAAAGQAASSYATVSGLSAMAGEAGIGGAVGGMGTLTIIGAAGGTLLIAGGVYGLSEIINTVNDAARKGREVKADAERLAGVDNGQQRSYAFGGVDKRAIIEDTVNALIQTTGGSTGPGGPEDILKNLALNMGQDLLSMFDYTNTSGEARNKLIDMLSMDNQNAAVAGMMLHYAGVDPGTVEYRDAYAKWQELTANGGMGYSWALDTMRGYFYNSGTFDENGNWVIPGFERSSNIMPVINGQPLANMSGYVMTPEASKPTTYTYTKPYTERYLTPGGHYKTREKMGTFTGEIMGTWDPSQHMATTTDALDGIFNSLKAGLQNSDMMTVTGSWWGRANSAPDENGVSSADLKGLKDVPAGVETAAEKGVRKGISGLKVEIDGQTAGRILAPYVSREIAALIQ